MAKSENAKIIIKHKDLDGVLRDCHDHIKKLLKKSKKNHSEEDYVFAIMFGILALEEIGKYEIFGNYQRELKDVPLREMEKLNSHIYKLTKPMEIDQEKRRKIFKDNPSKIAEFNKTAEYHKSQFRSLNIVKQLAMYYNFDKGHTITLENQFMKNEITKNNLGHFTLVLLELVYNRFNEAVLRQQCGTIDGTIDVNSESVKENPNYKDISEYIKRTKSKKYQVSLRKFQSTLLELEKLGTYLEK